MMININFHRLLKTTNLEATNLENLDPTITIHPIASLTVPVLITVPIPNLGYTLVQITTMTTTKHLPTEVRPMAGNIPLHLGETITAASVDDHAIQILNHMLTLRTTLGTTLHGMTTILSM